MFDAQGPEARAPSGQGEGTKQAVTAGNKPAQAPTALS